MTKLSRYSDPKRLSGFIHRFWNAVTLIEERNEAISFLKDLLTPTETRMIAKRLQIADMLAKGYKYQDIKNFVRVTEQTISSVNNKLQFGEDGLIKILKRLEKIDQTRQDKLEGKRSLFDQPAGLGRAVSNLTSVGISKSFKHHRKVRSVKDATEKL